MYGSWGRCVGASLGIIISALAIQERDVIAEEKPAEKITIMSVDDVRAGMEGTGRTVLEGTEIVSFQVKILGVLRDVAPGRDLVLARLSGANLEKTGVIAGMSGSPVYVDGKLLGAVAYAWGFAKEPIAGITPFEQMRGQAEVPKLPSAAKIETGPDGALPRSALDLTADPYASLNAATPIAAVNISDAALAGRQGRMLPISLPLSASGFGPRSLNLLSQHLSPLGILPVAAGRAPADQANRETPIVPGAALSVGLITGDMDLTGIGTVTHVEGNRVWGWGHPFMRSGQCQYLLQGGYIHLVNPNLNISTKMGSPLAVQGVINADVGSCIAGDLGAKPDLLPVLISITDGHTNTKREYRVQIVRHESLLGPLVATVLNNSIEELGNMPQELTIEMDATIKAQGLEPIFVKDVYSGTSVAGNEGVSRQFGQIAVVANALTRNPFQMARLESIECHTILKPIRSSAMIESARLKSDRLEAGDELVAVVSVRPHKQEPVDVEIRLPLPKTMPDGVYQATICDTTMHLRSRFTEEPMLLTARDVAGVAEAFRVQLVERRKTLFLRVLLPEQGVSFENVSLPQLPASAQAVFTSRRATPKQTVRQTLVARKSTDWAIEGSTTLRFTVSKDKRLSP